MKGLRFRQKLPEVPDHRRVDAAADENLRPARRQQLPDQRPARPGVGLLAGGQDGVHAQSGGLLQGLHGIPADVKSPVEGDTEALCRSDQA